MSGYMFEYGFYAMILFGIALLVSRQFFLHLKQQIDRRKYEFKCAEYLKNRGYKKVKVTQASNDRGVDIRAKKDGVKYVAECKYRKNKVDRQPIASIMTSSLFFDAKPILFCRKGLTKQAKEYARVVGVEVIIYDPKR